MRNFKRVKLQDGERVVVRVEDQELQITIQDGESSNEITQIAESSSFAITADSKTSRTPLSDSISISLESPQSPTLKTPSNSHYSNCGACLTGKGVMRICQPCFDQDSISTHSSRIAISHGHDSALITPGVLGVILVLLFLVAIALVDMSEWAWSRFNRRSLSSAEFEKAGMLNKDADDSDYYNEDELLIP